MYPKNQLRELALHARTTLGKEQRVAKSAQIASHLRHWQPFCAARTLCLYASFGTEVQTHLLFAELLAQQSRGEAAGASMSTQTLCLPRVEGAELVVHRIPPQLRCAASQGNSERGPRPPAEATDQATPLLSGTTAWPGLVRSPMGMPEPPEIFPVLEPQALGVILVPGSAFCLKSGQRLGYGKGFYDRLLARAPRALKVGLCFDVQLFDMDDFPSDPHDIPLDVLVSESGIRDLRGTRG